METSDLTVVIVTLKSEEVIFTCLDSIPSNIKVIVVENSNNKKLKEQLEEKYQKAIEYLEAPCLIEETTKIYNLCKKFNNIYRVETI